MLLPKLTVLGQTTKTLDDWKGLNCRASIAEEELADCANISTEELPALTGGQEGLCHRAEKAQIPPASGGFR